METTQMKHLFTTALFATAILMASTGAYAQSMAQATIPFDFTVGQTLLPAGTYHIDSVLARKVSLESRAGHVHMFYPVLLND